MAVSSVSNQKTMEDIIAASKKTTTDRNTGALGKDDFLNLLVTQLRYQDPLKPLEDKEFIAQMAQFTALEQTQNMNKTLTNSQAFSMLGKYVTAETTDDTTGQTSTIEGIVTNVKLSDGKAYITVNNKEVLAEKVTNVSESSSSANKDISQFTSLISYMVNGAVYDPSNGNIISASGQVKSLEKGKYEDYAVLDGVTLNVSTVTKADGTVLDTQSAIKSYLDSVKAGTDKAVSITAIDSTTGFKVPVKADLVDYSVDGDVIKTTLNNVYSPVESISKITK